MSLSLWWLLEGASLPFKKFASIACAGAERFVFVLASSVDCHIAITDTLHFFVLEATFTWSNMSLVGFRRFFCGFLFIRRLQCHAPCLCLQFSTCNVVVWFNHTWSHFLDSSFRKIPTSSATFVLIVCSIDRRCLHEVMRAFLCGWGWVYSSYTDSRLNFPPLYLLQLSEKWYIFVAFSTLRILLTCEQCWVQYICVVCLSVCPLRVCIEQTCVW